MPSIIKPRALILADRAPTQLRCNRQKREDFGHCPLCGTYFT